MSSGSTLESARARLLAVCEGRRPAQPAMPERGSEPHQRDAAVLVLFGALDRVPATTSRVAVAPELDVLLTRRADTLTHHPGQVSFPGGRIDPGDDGPVAAALREAQEETGLDPAGVEVLGMLPDRTLSVSRYWVTPVVGWWREPSAVRAVDPLEATAVFRAPVADLVDPRHRRKVRIRTRDGEYGSPGFVVGEHLVWGFTALVLDSLLDWTGWAVPWDASPTLDLVPPAPGRPWGQGGAAPAR